MEMWVWVYLNMGWVGPHFTMVILTFLSPLCGTLFTGTLVCYDLFILFGNNTLISTVVLGWLEVWTDIYENKKYFFQYINCFLSEQSGPLKRNKIHPHSFSSCLSINAQTSQFKLTHHSATSPVHPFRVMHHIQSNWFPWTMELQKC